MATISGEHRLHIYYEDTDFSGFVYHSNYLKFFERAREHLLGLDLLRESWENGTHFVVTRAEIDYKAPAKHGDCLLIRTQIEYSRSPILSVSQSAILFDLEGGEKVLVHGQITLAALNRDNRPTRLNKALLERMATRNHVAT